MKGITAILFTIICCSSVFCQTTVTFKPNATSGQDALIATNGNYIPNGQTQLRANMNDGNNQTITTSAWTYNADGCPDGTNRSLLRFDELSTIPANATIIRAELKLYGVSHFSGVPISVGNSCYPGTPSLYGNSCPNKAFIQKVTSAWNEQTVTWNSQPTTITNQITIPQTNLQWNWNFTDSSANLLAMVQDWVQNPTTNFGFMIRLETENYYRSVLFASSDHPNSALHPELTLTYEIKGQGSKNTTKFNITICEGNTYNKNGFNHSKSGTYTQELQNRFGCDSLVILDLYVANKDTTLIFDTICQGETYNKNGFNVSKPDTYRQNLQNHYNCDSLVILNLTVNPNPDIEINALTDRFCEEDFIELQVVTDGDSFQWNTGSSENPLTITKSGTYSATAYLSNCKKTASYTVEECPCIVFIPNAFTPNGDGLNDVWKPVISCSETMTNYKLTIYDRWGNRIFQSSDYSAGWSGTDDNGKDYASGVYNGVFEYTTSKNERVVKTVLITLLR